MSTDEDREDGDDNCAKQLCNGTNNDNHTGEVFGNGSAGEEESLPDEDQEPVTSAVSPFSSESKSQTSPLSDVPSPGHSPAPPESLQTDIEKEPSNGPVAESEEPVESPCADADITPVTENGAPLPLSPEVIVGKGCGQSCNGTSSPPSPRVTRRHKRKREDISPDSPQPADDAVHDRYKQRICLRGDFAGA